MSWPRARIKEVCLVVADGTHASPERTSAEGVPVLSAQNVRDNSLVMSTGRFTTSAELALFNKRLTPTVGDVLLTIVGTIGRSAVLEALEPFVLQRSVAVLRPDTTKIDARYLKRVCDSPDFQNQLARASNTSTQAGIYLGRLSGLEVPLPPLPEQRRIASILDQTDGLRLLRRSTIRALEALLSTLSIDISKAEDWPLATLGSLAELQGGLTVNQRRHDYRLQTEYLRVANVMRGEMRLGEIKVVGVTEAELARVVLHHGDVLVVEGHGNLGEVGRAAMWRGASTKMVHQNHLIRVRALPARLNSTFLESVLNSSAGRRHFHSVAKTTSGLNTINMADVRSFAIKVPPLEVQQAFAQEVMRVADAQALHREHLTKLDELFASLQDRAFKGEL